MSPGSVAKSMHAGNSLAAVHPAAARCSGSFLAVRWVGRSDRPLRRPFVQLSAQKELATGSCGTRLMSGSDPASPLPEFCGKSRERHRGRFQSRTDRAVDDCNAQNTGGSPSGPERLDHAEGLPGSGGRSAAEGRQLQRRRQGSQNDARRRCLVRGRLRPRAYEHELRYSTERFNWETDRAAFSSSKTFWCACSANVTATECMVLRLGQLQSQGLMSDEHASLAKAFCTVKCRETVGYARELLGGNGMLR